MFTEILRTADLATEFGREYATWLFGEEAIASLPVRKSGKNKGCPKGVLHWIKCRTPGYSKSWHAPFAEGQLVRAWIAEGNGAPGGAAMRGQFLGRVQALCASPIFLGPANRAAEMERQAQYLEDQERRNAEFKRSLL